MELIVQTSSGLEYRIRFDSVDWDDSVDMLNAAWAEIEAGGIFYTTDSHAVRFNPANINAILAKDS